MTPKPFFSSLQSWVRQESGADYGGRFVGMLIKHVATADEVPFRRFFASVTRDSVFHRGELRIEAEHFIATPRGRRRLDLVVYVDGVMRLAIELKYRDRLAPGLGDKQAQLSEYLRYCARQSPGCYFLLLHREPQQPADLESINKAGQFACHYSALANVLEASGAQPSKMLLDYLREEGLVYERIDADHFYRFCHRLLLPSRGSGRIVVTSEIEEGPRQLQHLLSNMRLIAAEITQRLRRAAGGASSRTATVDYSLGNIYMRKALLRSLGSSQERELSLDQRSRVGGTLTVWAQNALPAPTRGKWFYVDYGFDFGVQKGWFMDMSIYAQFRSPEIGKDVRSQAWGDPFAPYLTLSTKDLEDAKGDNFAADFVSLIRRAAASTLKTGVIADQKRRSVLEKLKRL